MIGRDEIEDAFVGCWRVAFGSTSGLRHFDLSADGFWRSFRVAGVIAGFDGIDAVLHHFAGQDGAADTGPGAAIWLFIIAALTTLVTFAAFPAIVAIAARPLGLAERYASYVTVRNWLMFFLAFPVYLVNAVSYADWLPEDVLTLLALAYDVVLLMAGFSVARVVLGAATSIAMGLTLIDFLMMLLIARLATILFL